MASGLAPSMEPQQQPRASLNVSGFVDSLDLALAVTQGPENIYRGTAFYAQGTNLG